MRLWIASRFVFGLSRSGIWESFAEAGPTTRSRKLTSYRSFLGMRTAPYSVARRIDRARRRRG
jgi:hypothetical protein